MLTSLLLSNDTRLEIQIYYKIIPLFCGMNLSLSYAKNRREGLVFLLFALLVMISLLTRILLAFKTSAQIDFGALMYVEVTFIGLFYDIVTAVYFCLPFVIYLWLIPQRLYARPGHIYVLYGWFSILLGSAAVSSTRIAGRGPQHI